MTKKTRIGLDIGSSAVRAAEVMIDGNKKVLRRFAQVGLPAGAVVEGEVQDQAVVAAALRRLWQHGRFSGKTVVVGLGSQRAMVRQVEMPPMSDVELRSALRFKMGEFLPIPVEQAVVDFAPLAGGTGADGGRRVLLVAAQREVVADEVAAVEAAGLRVEAADSCSLALLRAVVEHKGPPGGGGGGTGEGLEAVVGIGAELVTVAVRDAGGPRFVRTVALGGSSGAQFSNESIGQPGSAERMAPFGGRNGNRSSTVMTASSRLEAIVNEVRTSLEYLLSQSGTEHFERVLITGGGAMLAGVGEALSSALGLPVTKAELPFQIDSEELGLDKDALEEASYRWLSAVGLALWGTDAYGAPSLLPAEILAKRKQRRAFSGVAAGIGVLAVVLAGASYGPVHSADNISGEISQANTETQALNQKINQLGYVLEVPAEVQDRRQMAQEGLVGDINWLGLLRRIEIALPASVTVQSVQMTKTEAISSSGTSAAPAAPGSVIGSVAMSAETTGGAQGVSQFIDRVSKVSGLFALWVSSTTKSTGETMITANALVTTAAFSTRAATLPGGTK